MISNILLKANLLAVQDHMQEPQMVPAYDKDLGSINAFELRSICERFEDGLGISFNPSWYRRVNERQQRQWTARLFFKDRSLSMKDDGRQAWALISAQEFLLRIEEELAGLDVEDALELLWLADQAASSLVRELVQAATAARGKLLEFLKHYNFSEQAALERVRGFGSAT